MIISREPECRSALHPIVSNHNILDNNYRYEWLVNEEEMKTFIKILCASMLLACPMCNELFTF